MIFGTAYGVVLNDSEELGHLQTALLEPPYKAAPVWPVVYIKPRNCFSFGGAPIPLDPEFEEVAVAATVAVQFGRDAARVESDQALSHISGACLAIDAATARGDYYRPAVAQSCRDGFLPLGAFAAPTALPKDIVTRIDGVIAHRWSTQRLVRPLQQLIAELSSFMTFRAGDLLLAGLAGDAPRARRGQSIEIAADNLPPLRTRIEPLG